MIKTSETENNISILVSIITVVYNGGKYLEQTILTVLNQSYKNIEYIIIDGGSTDDSLKIIKKYENQIHYWNSEPDKGIYDAMNKGIAIARGEIIGIINSDDWYEVDCIERVVNCYMQNKESVIYGLMRNIENEQPIEICAAFPNSILVKMLPHPTCFVPKYIYNTYGVFNLKYKSCADYQFLLRLYESGVSFILLEHVLANFRVGGFSSRFKSLKESFKMRNEMGFLSKKQQILRTLGVYIVSKFRK